METNKLYKCRAEVESDIHKFLKKAKGSVKNASITNCVVSLSSGEVVPIPDCELTFESSLSLIRLRRVLQRIPDAHVMEESLNYKNEYTGERTMMITERSSLAAAKCDFSG